MYHTFQANTGPMPGAELEMAKAKTGNSRRISTSNACVECRRRKIRCDGAQPCGQCQWYRHPDACRYCKPTQRVVPSRKLLDKLSSSLAQHESLFARLFPGQDVELLLSLPREELINMALTLPAGASSPAISEHHYSQPDSGASRSDGAESLEALEQAPDQDPELDEAKRRLDNRVQRVSDDVNGLSLSVDKQSSYVGASSITAALKVIFKVAPGAKHFLAQDRPSETALPTRDSSPAPDSKEANPLYLPPAEIGHALIEAYFTRIHALMPMIDEQQFWHTWLYGERRDSAWLALLNTVFTLGSLASSDADSDQHTIFFQRARQHLSLETFGSGNILVLQALGLLSGYYLHYVNRPNLANNIMGATLRMATVLGLHREFAEPMRPDAPFNGVDSIPSEVRRRTWWSLVCLDTWASVTTGRPALGRLGAGITVRPPQLSTNKMNNSQYFDQLKVLPLIHNASFSKISTRIQDTLATTHLLRFEDLITLDAQLVAWHDDLPSILLPLHPQQFKSSSRKRTSSTQPLRPPTSAHSDVPFDFSVPPDQTIDCPEFLKTARAVMHWRYQNLRIVLHRPSLLAAALRRAPFTSLSSDEKVAVGRCRIIAAQTITDINSMCGEELIAAWNGVWFMYQAVLVPLVSLFSHLSVSARRPPDSPQQGQPGSPSHKGDGEVEKWRSQIETAISFFDRMLHWSLAAKKSREVVSKLYDASKQLSDYTNAQQQYEHQLRHTHEQRELLESNDHMTVAGGLISEPNNDLNLTTQPSIPFDVPITPNTSAFTLPPSLVTALQTNFTDMHDGFRSQPIWGYSPSGDSSLECFWNEEMQWDSLPSPFGPPMNAGATTGGIDMQQENMAQNFGLGEYDWFGSMAQGSVTGVPDVNSHSHSHITSAPSMGGGGGGDTRGRSRTQIPRSMPMTEVNVMDMNADSSTNGSNGVSGVHDWVAAFR